MSGEATPADPADRTGARRARLLGLVRELAVSYGDFTLASGRKSRYYLDGRLVTLHPEGAYLIARSILDIIAGERIEAKAIGGLTLGADPIAGAVAAVSHLHGPPLSAFIVRKEAKAHGTGRRVEGALKHGDEVVVVDDVVTTAGSTLQAIRAVEEIGCKVAAVVCLVDREEGGAEALKGYRFYPLFKVTELVEDKASRA
ncbi:MAG TPA: orotate phosphoribosyltransferase [Candidatus Polarisedimenticolia bacterium]|nr:orotate phosphoribosyltransferase [Candidatus Polarisedimenticolia bacterium]